MFTTTENTNLSPEILVSQYVLYLYNITLIGQSNLFSKDRVSRKVAQVYELQMQSPKFCQNAAAARRPRPISTDSTKVWGGKRNTEKNHDHL